MGRWRSITSKYFDVKSKVPGFWPVYTVYGCTHIIPYLCTILTSYILILAYFSYYQSIRLRTRSQIVQNAFILSVPWHSRFHLPTSGDPHAAAFETCKSPFPGLCDVSDARMTPQESNRCPQTEELRYVTWQGSSCVPFLNGHSLWAHPHFETSYDESYEPYCWYVDIALYPNVVPMYLNVHHVSIYTTHVGEIPNLKHSTDLGPKFSANPGTPVIHPWQVLSCNLPLVTYISKGKRTRTSTCDRIDLWQKTTVIVNANRF